MGQKQKPKGASRVELDFVQLNQVFYPIRTTSATAKQNQGATANSWELLRMLPMHNERSIFVNTSGLGSELDWLERLENISIFETPH